VEKALHDGNAEFKHPFFLPVHSSQGSPAAYDKRGSEDPMFPGQLSVLWFPERQKSSSRKCRSHGSFPSVGSSHFGEFPARKSAYPVSKHFVQVGIGGRTRSGKMIFQKADFKVCETLFFIDELSF
jgi:hypothetical protein